MRFVLALVLGLASAFAQTCVPGRILPTGALSGTLDGSSCLLSDGTGYATYRLDLPTRGHIDITVSSAGLSLILRDSTGARIDSGTAVSRSVEAGSYSVVVNAPAALTAPGAYTVQTAFRAEPGMLCTAFPNAGLNQTIAGTLGASGCVMPDGTPFEGYLLTTLGAGTLTIQLSSPDFTTALTLRDADGYPIASDAQSISVPVDADDQYEIVVSTAGQTGTYQLTTSFQPGEGETCRPRMSLTGPATDSASITVDSCTATMAPAGDAAYYNYYDITVTAAGLADLTAASTDFDATLYLLDDGGNVLAVDSGGSGLPGQSEIRLQLAPGNYTAQVLSSVPSGGSYSFAYQFTPGPPQPCTPVTANPGDALAGTLSAASCRSSLGLADLYSFTLASSGTLDVTLTATGFTSLLAILDAKDNLIVQQEDVQALGAAHLTADLPPGVYSIVAAAGSGSGGYQVTSKFTAHDIPPCSYVQPLDINGGYIQRLGPGSCRGPNGQPLDLYQFTLPSESVVAAFMTSSSVDGYLTLTDSPGNTLRTDDNSYGGIDPMIIQFLPAGTYQVAARAAGNTLGGYYEVDLRTVPGPRPSFCSSKSKLPVGGSISGTLGVASCQYVDATFADLYEIDLPADTTIDLRLTSVDFDAFLVLLDAKGNVVDQDDDSGGNTDARLNRLLAAGTYYVVAKPASDYVHVGAYTLSLAQSQSGSGAAARALR
ncbi:MAG TPA: PPC domain-containing protein [Bryobacteraceae bacterium]